MKNLWTLIPIQLMLVSLFSGFSTSLLAEESADLGTVTITAPHLNPPPGIIPEPGLRPTNNGGPSGGQGPIGGGLPPIPGQPPDCDTGDPEIDNTADHREQLWEEAFEEDRDNPVETGGLFWPDGNGGYDLLRFGVEIPGGSADACNIHMPPVSAFPPADEWPTGVIIFHVHPYIPVQYVRNCRDTYHYGPSPLDRENLSDFKRIFRDDVQGMVMDRFNIYKFGETRSEDEGRVRRCK